MLADEVDYVIYSCVLTPAVRALATSTEAAGIQPALRTSGVTGPTLMKSSTE